MNRWTGCSGGWFPWKMLRIIRMNSYMYMSVSKTKHRKCFGIRRLQLEMVQVSQPCSRHPLVASPAWWFVWCNFAWVCQVAHCMLASSIYGQCRGEMARGARNLPHVFVFCRIAMFVYTVGFKIPLWVQRREWFTDTAPCVIIGAGKLVLFICIWKFILFLGRKTSLGKNPFYHLTNRV